MEALFAAAITRAYTYESAGTTWEERGLSGFNEFADMVVEQPDAAKLCHLEAFAAGPEAIQPLEQATVTVERLTKLRLDESPEHAGMPDELIAAFVGASLEIIRSRLIEGKEAELTELGPDIVDFFLTYRPPPEPLRLSTRPPSMAPEALEAHDHGERALRGLAAVVAEQGYTHTTVDQIVKRASMSPTTFYANFSDKEDAMMAAIDSAGARMTAAVLPAFGRNPDWPRAVRGAFGALFNFLASRPALAQLLVVEVYAAGPKAIKRRDAALGEFEAALIEEGRRRNPEVSLLAAEAIQGGINALAYKQVRDHGPQSLTALAPIATYYTLLPFVGPEEACEAANSDGRSRPARSPVPSSLQERKLRLLNQMGDRFASPAELANELAIHEPEVRDHLAELEDAGLVEVIETADEESGGGSLYRSQLRKMDAEWREFDLSQRLQITEQIGHLIFSEFESAVESGIIDERPERHLSRMPFIADEQGWREMQEVHDKALDSMIEIRDKSLARLERSGKPPIRGRSIQVLFEIAPETGEDPPTKAPS